MRRPSYSDTFSGTYAFLAMIVNVSVERSFFSRGNNCSQWVSTPPSTRGIPRKPVTHMIITLSPCLGRSQNVIVAERLRVVTVAMRFRRHLQDRAGNLHPP